ALELLFYAEFREPLYVGGQIDFPVFLAAFAPLRCRGVLRAEPGDQRMRISAGRSPPEFVRNAMLSKLRGMSFETLITKWLTLNTSVEALAALGAELRLRQEELKGDSRVRSLLQDVVRRIDPELLDAIEPNEERAAFALIQTSFRQAIDLIENPARAPGWN